MVKSHVLAVELKSQESCKLYRLNQEAFVWLHVHIDLLLLWQANLDFCLESAGHSSWADQQKLLQVKDQMDTIGVCTLAHPADSRCASSRVDHWSTVHPRTACSGQCLKGRISARLHVGVVSDFNPRSCHVQFLHFLF